MAHPSGSADNESAFANRRKDGVAVARSKEFGTRSGILKEFDGIAVAVGKRGENRQRQ
jgi:hypothetical protein